MRILVLAPQLPYPPDKGTRIRTFGLIKELARRHEIGVLSFGDPEDHTAKRELAGHCRVVGVVPLPKRRMAGRVLRALFDPTPDLARRLADREYGRRLAVELGEDRWDLLQVEGIEMAPHWWATRAAAPPTVLDAHNAEWLLQFRAARTDAAAGRAVGALYSFLQAARLRRYEGRTISAVHGVAAVSAADARALAAVAKPRRLTIVPNGVDTKVIERRRTEPTGLVVLFSGTMDYRPNIDAVDWFARRVWPMVREREPAARFIIAGRDPTPAVRRLADVPGVQVTGAIPDIAPLFAEATVYAAPLRIGGGARLKLLEAFAYGVPVVSTSLGAEGIEVVDGRDVLLADEADSFAAAVLRMLGDAALRRHLAHAARRLAEEHYDWRVLTPALERLHAEVLRNSFAPPVSSDVGH